MRPALVLGGTGLVGGALLGALAKRGKEAVGTSTTASGFEKLDLRDAPASRALILKVGPGVIYHAAARPSVDECEEHPEETRAVNVAPMAGLAAAAAECGARLVFFSSDYVFSGEAGPYAEEDPTGPVNEYGRQKLQAEAALSASCCDWLALRTTVVFGPEPAGKNFVARLGRELAAGRRPRVPADQFGSPTYAPDLAEAAIQLAEHGEGGVVHLCGPDVVGRLELAREAARAYGLDPGLIDGVPTAALGQKARRPLRAGMRTAKARARLGRELVDYKKALRLMAAVSDFTASS